MPPDKLHSATREVEFISDAAMLQDEEDRLRNAPALAAAEQEMNKPWFATNVVDHRFVGIPFCGSTRYLLGIFARHFGLSCLCCCHSCPCRSIHDLQS